METYAKRLNNPFRGLLQVVATTQVRALSFDGRYWELQFLCDMHQLKPALRNSVPRFQYARIGQWDTQRGFQPYPLDPVLDRAEVEQHYGAVVAALGNVHAPLPQDDVYEYWLLDEQNAQPLALLASCRTAAEMAELTPRQPCWKAVSAAQLAISYTGEETRRGMPPVAYRLEVQVKARAGQNPLARWYRRNPDGSGQESSQTGGDCALLPASAFPELLLREDWPNNTAQDLCDRYLQRLAPQLLVLQGLSHSARDRLEQMASQHVVEMDRCFHLYPAVADPQRMTAWRVEARLRVACGRE